MDFGEKLREAACIGDTDAVNILLNENVDVNSKNAVNGWTALHWACKRGNPEIVRILMNRGADPKIINNKDETPGNICSNPKILELLGTNDIPVSNINADCQFIPSYIKNSSLNGQVDLGWKRTKHSDFGTMPTTSLPAAQDDDLVLKIRIAGTNDPDFIEIEIPKWKLTYNYLLKIICEELQCSEQMVERIRKLPNTRLRKDSDVKRLSNFQSLELVLSATNIDKASNCYQSISTCKDQTILY